ncbi:HNH endonuclease signature motif containing protein [Enterococcus sp. FR169]|nr:HNH endonuclease signature motif containing protein [Enterococcus sp. FR169]MDQ8644368.1 HNH endonuclease signature motif containing protein [Enterococcus sp. FR169]
MICWILWKNYIAMSIKKQCNHAGCRELVPFNEKYCQKHQKTVKRVYKKDYHERKANEGRYFAFYRSKAWRKLSYTYRLNHPVCEECLSHGIIVKSDMVDHMEEIRDNWDRRYDETNLRALCWSCHNTKTARERKRRELNQ